MKAVKDGNHIRIYDAYLIRESIKEIPGRFYDPDERTWSVPLTTENASLLALLGVELEKDLVFPSESTETLEKPVVPMPIKATPYQHQIRAFNFCLRLFGIGGDAQ